jgi:hypothetical protein
MRGTPPSERFRNLDRVSVTNLEAVVAHELNHVMTAPMLYTDEAGSVPWKQRVTREIVSEGIAFLCNPLNGFQKDVWEDRTTLAAMVKDLNDTFEAYQKNIIGDEELSDWFGSTFQERATAHLARYLKRAYPDSNLIQMVRDHSIYRPDLVHALGSWMVARVTSHGEKKETVAMLLEDPSMVYSLYNATLDPGMEDLAIPPDVVALMKQE